MCQGDSKHPGPGCGFSVKFLDLKRVRPDRRDRILVFIDVADLC